MALVWKCDRCGRTSHPGDVDNPPDGWRQTDRPVRGSEGARSLTEATLCDGCDDELYSWWGHA